MTKLDEMFDLAETQMLKWCENMLMEKPIENSKIIDLRTIKD